MVYRPDIFVKKEDNLVLVECCSCKIRKIMDYLTKSNEVWVLTKGDPPWRDSLFNERMKFFVFKKGQNWDKFIKIKKKELKKQLEKVKSPLDTL